MKKLLVILAAAGMLLAFSSCSKSCVCRTYLEDEVVSEDEIEVGGKTSYKNCSELQKSYETVGLAYDSTSKAGVKCD